MLKKIKSWFKKKEDKAEVDYTLGSDKLKFIKSDNTIFHGDGSLWMLDAEWGLASLNHYEAVKDFHEAFDHPVGEEPKPLSSQRTYDRSKWTVEEVIETIYASSEDNEEFIRQCIKLSEDVLKMSQETLDKNNHNQPPQDDLEKMVGQVDGLVDALYFINGSFVELGIDPQPIFDIVQSANMGKLDENGQPILRESDNKIQKPLGWEENFAPEPRIRKEIEKQIEESQQEFNIEQEYDIEFGVPDYDGK